MADPTTDAGNPPWDREPGASAGAGKARACLIMTALTVAVLALLYWGAQWWLDRTWDRHREQIRKDIRTVEPLLSALEMYRADCGAYPPTLSHLTPQYILSIPPPSFDFPADEWQYVSGRAEVQAWADEKREGEPPLELPDQVYSLWVWVPAGYTPLSGLLSDALVYHSNEQYARFAYGGGLEPIDGWAYYHE